MVVCFTLSGFAALVYQTAWLRQFSLVFGTSELAVATVLAAYMGGLALGAALAGRYVGRVERPVLVYGLLEAGIALSALAVPMLLLAARTIYASVLGAQPSPPDAGAIGQPIFYLLAAFVVLAIPTGLMGATLPLLIRYAVRTNREVGPRVALLYAANTGGAVLGTVAAAFVLLPALGLSRTVWVGVAANGLVFGVAALLARRMPSSDGESAGVVATAPPGFFEACVRPLFRPGSPPRDRLEAAFRSQPGWILPVILVSGAMSFVYEVLWTRMLAHVMGGSIYAFATMLAAFLTGIALGGGLAGKIAERRERAAGAFAICQVAIAALSMGIYAWMVPLIPETLTSFRVALYSGAVMLPATIFIGATLPLSIRVLARDETEATAGTARIYSWNTVGAIAGAVLAGFYLIPGLGFGGTIKFAVVTNLALALWTVTVITRLKPVYVGVGIALFTAALGAYTPARRQALLSRAALALSNVRDPREIYYGVGRSSTVMLLEEDGYYHMRTNGLPEASIAAKGGPPYQDAERWMSALAVTARPSAEDMLVIGFGGGVALEGVPASVDRIDVVELEPEVISANRALAGSRDVDPLADPRFKVVINDARNALRLTSKRYDVIASQPSHPWTAGASHLFTREFVADAKSHLNEGGVFVQWMNSDFVTEPLLRTLAATLLAEFENVRLYIPLRQDLVFLASDGPLDLEEQVARTGQPFASEVMHFSRLGMNGIEDLLAGLAMDEAGVASFARRAPLSTDDNNRMAIDSRSIGDGIHFKKLMTLLEAYDPLLKRESWVYARLGNRIDYGYLARRMAQVSSVSRAFKLADVVSAPSTRLEILGWIYQANEEKERAEEALRGAIAADPRNMQARYLLVKGRLARAGRGDAPEDLQAIVDGMTGPARAVTEGEVHALKKDWPELARLDAELGRSKVTDAWYPEAVRLRAEWRAHVRTAGPPGDTFDALGQIERALVLAPDRDLHSLRAAIALELGDGDRVLESSRYLIARLEADLTTATHQAHAPPMQRLSGMRQTLSTIAGRLQGDLNIRDPERVRRLLGRANDLIRQIDEYPRAN